MSRTDCTRCGHPLLSHNLMNFAGPVCLLCGCGDEFVIEDQPPPVKVWRELGVMMLVVTVVFGGIVLLIEIMQRMVFLK